MRTALLTGVIILSSARIFYLNIFTHSLPYGIYMRIGGTPQRGDYAASCLTPEIAQYGMDRRYLVPGNCPAGSVKVLKVIKGVPGDHFTLSPGSLVLNGHAYPIKIKDSTGRTLKTFYQQGGILGSGEYLLLSDFVPNSWDSRYWGPVGIEFLLKPLLVFEKYKV